MYTFLIILLSWFQPHSASAHVRWFVEPAEAHTAVFSIPPMQLVLAISAFVIAVVVAVVISRRFPQPPVRFTQVVEAHKRLIGRIVTISLGTWLILMCYKGNLLTPILHIDNTFTLVLEMLAIIAGILLILGFFTRATGVLLGLLWIGIGMHFGWVSMLENAELLGIAAFVYLTPKHPYATPSLRLGTGIALLMVALDEKLLAPGWSVAFLAHYQWNMAAQFGMSDALFIVCAGLSELFFAVLFSLGIFTRLVTLGIASVMITTAVLLGPGEVVGHLPFFAIGLWLVCYGGGQKLTLSKAA